MLADVMLLRELCVDVQQLSVHGVRRTHSSTRVRSHAQPSRGVWEAAARCDWSSRSTLHGPKQQQHQQQHPELERLHPGHRVMD